MTNNTKKPTKINLTLIQYNLEVSKRINVLMIETDWYINDKN